MARYRIGPFSYDHPDEVWAGFVGQPVEDFLSDDDDRPLSVQAAAYAADVPTIWSPDPEYDGGWEEWSEDDVTELTTAIVDYVATRLGWGSLVDGSPWRLPDDMATLRAGPREED